MWFGQKRVVDREHDALAHLAVLNCQPVDSLREPVGRCNVNKNSAHQIMHGCGWLSRQPEDFRRDLLESTRLTRYLPGQSLYNLDDEASGMYGLVDGTLEVQLANGQVVTVGSPGYWIGEAAAFKRMPRRASVIAKTKAHVLHLPLAEFDRLASNAGYCRCLATLTVERLEEALTVIADLMTTSAMHRVCARLLTLATVENNGNGSLAVTQAELASMCGLSRQSVNKSLNRLVQDRVVSLTYGKLTIVDEDKLRLLAYSRDVRD
jgi:CRP-like cAMP-binding protein